MSHASDSVYSQSFVDLCFYTHVKFFLYLVDSWIFNIVFLYMEVICINMTR